MKILPPASDDNLNEYQMILERFIFFFLFIIRFLCGLVSAVFCKNAVQFSREKKSWVRFRIFCFVLFLFRIMIQTCRTLFQFVVAERTLCFKQNWNKKKSFLRDNNRVLFNAAKVIAWIAKGKLNSNVRGCWMTKNNLLNLSHRNKSCFFFN